MRHCTDCPHHTKGDGVDRCMFRGHFESPVDGEYRYPLCENMRRDEHACGPGAQWFPEEAVAHERRQAG